MVFSSGFILSCGHHYLYNIHGKDATMDSTFNETLTNMKKDSNKVWGIILIVLGTIFLLDEWIPDFDFGKFWPLILIAVGGYIIFRDKDKIDFNNDKNNL
jgi:phage shock protein C